MINKVVYKYPLVIGDNGTWVPQGEVVLIDVQGGTITAWVLQDRDERNTQKLMVVGTGWEVPQASPGVQAHVGSVVVKPSVWHVFVAGYRLLRSDLP